jgi:hypothetical protein
VFAVVLRRTPLLRSAEKRVRGFDKRSAGEDPSGLRRENAKDEYRRMIFWKRYSFCSAWCQYNTESDIRKSWKRSTRNLIR